jgi:hypothetical protein
MIGVARSIILANSQKHAQSRADPAHRSASDGNLGLRYSLDNGSHGEWALATRTLVELARQQGLASIGSSKRIDDLRLHRDGSSISGNKENHV